MGNDIEIDPSFDRVAATTYVYPAALLRSQSSPYATRNEQPSDGKPHFIRDLVNEINRQGLRHNTFDNLAHTSTLAERSS
jgi:hypothetical protein